MTAPWRWIGDPLFSRLYGDNNGVEGCEWRTDTFSPPPNSQMVEESEAEEEKEKKEEQ
jgi:hypothetical protein